MTQAQIDSITPDPANILADYLTPGQVCETLSVSQKTLDRWHRLRKASPRITIGRTRLYSIQSFREWLGALEEEKAPKRMRRKA